jgi:nifR3 family TIM-barrel protein
MNKSFWGVLKKPFFCSAPMYGISDEAFRRMLLKYGRPDVFWTEMVPADGLVFMAEKGGMNSQQAKLLMKILQFVHQERPIVVQVFGANPENFYKSAILLRQMGFDGIDINTGCPEKNIEKQGSGAALIKNPNLVKEIIAAVKEGANNVPVSLKTRIGYSKDITAEWIGFLLGQELDALTIHCRTRNEGFGGEAHWKTIREAVNLRSQMASKTIIIGNGGIADMADARNKLKESGADGAMIGRALLGNPWFFNATVEEPLEIIKEKKFRAILEHIAIFEETFGGIKNFEDLKKHFAAYSSGFTGAKNLRMALMQAESAEKARQAVAEFNLKR